MMEWDGVRITGYEVSGIGQDGFGMESSWMRTGYYGMV